MKKIILLMTLILSSAMFKVANAQPGITVNIGSQPVWGPTGYDYAEYYYFPDMDVYYHIPDRTFTYFDGRNWISAYSLPPFYSNYDLYRTYKVVINEPRPYLRNDFWRSRYSSYRGRQQEIIYNSRDSRYFVINEHPQHTQWMASRANSNRGYNDSRVGSIGRNDVYRNDVYRNDDHRYDNNRRYDNNQRSSEVNNQRQAEVVRNDRDTNDRNRTNNNGRANENGRSNDNRRPNENDQRDNGNGRFNGGRRN